MLPLSQRTCMTLCMGKSGFNSCSWHRVPPAKVRLWRIKEVVMWVGEALVAFSVPTSQPPGGRYSRMNPSLASSLSQPRNPKQSSSGETGALFSLSSYIGYLQRGTQTHCPLSFCTSVLSHRGHSERYGERPVSVQDTRFLAHTRTSSLKVHSVILGTEEGSKQP